MSGQKDQMSGQKELTPEEAVAMFGAPVEPVPPDEREMELALALRRIRSLLVEASVRHRVGVSDLAARLDVSPSVVSRLLRSEGDMRVSTAIEWAYALGCVWEFNLRDMHAASVGSNQVFPVRADAASIAASAPEAPLVRTIDLGTPQLSQTLPIDAKAAA